MGPISKTIAHECKVAATLLYQIAEDIEKEGGVSAKNFRAFWKMMVKPQYLIQKVDQIFINIETQVSEKK